MLSWLFLLVLLIVQGVLLRWWLHKEFYPFFFNDKASLIYSVGLAVDFILTWLVSFLVKPGGTLGTAVLALAGIFLIVIVFLGRLFLGWAIRSNLDDVK